jgi:nucleoid DNA-binding protein
MAERVDKPELVQRVARRLDRDGETVAEIVDGFLEETYAALKGGEGVSLRGFGSFYVRAERDSLGVQVQPVAAPARAVWLVVELPWTAVSPTMPGLKPEGEARARTASSSAFAGGTHLGSLNLVAAPRHGRPGPGTLPGGSRSITVRRWVAAPACPQPRIEIGRWHLGPHRSSWLPCQGAAWCHSAAGRCRAPIPLPAPPTAAWGREVLEQAPEAQAQLLGHTHRLVRQSAPSLRLCPALLLTGFVHSHHGASLSSSATSRATTSRPCWSR